MHFTHVLQSTHFRRSQGRAGVPVLKTTNPEAAAFTSRSTAPGHRVSAPSALHSQSAAVSGAGEQEHDLLFSFLQFYRQKNPESVPSS